MRAARRIALGAQGFAAPRPSGRIDVRHFRRVMRTVGVLQLDSVNVLERSHYLLPFSRLGGYDRAALDAYTSHSGELFEYWGHMASLLPVGDYPLFRWRMASMEPWKRVRALEAEHPGYIDEVEEEVRRRGPLTVSDFADGGKRTGPWWGYGRGKIALEWLFATGRITARRGRQFTRVYDLTDRVLPREVRAGPAPDGETAQRELLVRAARHLGIATAADLADYYRLHVPTARRLVTELAGDGDLVPVRVDGWRDPAYLHPATVRARTSRGTALLSPFDSLIWDRARTERLFGFRYRIEIYVPRTERVFGYYVLPFLLDGGLVGRVDLKAHRSDGVLEVRAAHHEPGVEPGRVAEGMRAEIGRVASWLGLERVKVGRAGNLIRALRDAFDGRSRRRA